MKIIILKLLDGVMNSPWKSEFHVESQLCIGEKEAVDYIVIRSEEEGEETRTASHQRRKEEEEGA
jgi:hypothetical protein